MCDFKVFILIGCLLSAVVARPQFNWEEDSDEDFVGVPSGRQQQQQQQRQRQRQPNQQLTQSQWLQQQQQQLQWQQQQLQQQQQQQLQQQQPSRQPGPQPGQPSATTPAPANAVTTPSPRFLACLQNCPTTSEYNPVCGSDMMNYHNNGRLDCARNCGKNVSMVRMGTCRPLS